MFDPDRFVRVLMLAASLLALGGAWTFILRRTLLEVFRQRLFGLRRELFLIMADGEIAPDHPLYVALRSTMNGMLRFAEHLSFTRVLIVSVLGRATGAAYAERMDLLFRSVESMGTRKRLMRLRRRLGIEIIKFITLTSPVLWLLSVVLVPIVLLTEGVRALRDMALTAPVVRLEAEAECEGSGPMEQAA